MSTETEQGSPVGQLRRLARNGLVLGAGVGVAVGFAIGFVSGFDLTRLLDRYRSVRVGAGLLLAAAVLDDAAMAAREARLRRAGQPVLAGQVRDPGSTGRGPVAITWIALAAGTGLSVLFLLRHRDRAQPVWLALAAAGLLAAAAGADLLYCRRRAAGRSTSYHQHDTHGGRPGQGRTRTAAGRWRR